MFDKLSLAIALLFGDPGCVTWEDRLFNAISLLSAVTNLGGLPFVLKLENWQFVLVLKLAIGLLFLSFYLLSRFRNATHVLFWPFVLCIAAFLLLNALNNAASLGGAHYYLIPALVIAIITSNSVRRRMIVFVLFGITALAVVYLERTRPDLISMHRDAKERAYDVASNFLFAQIFTGVIVLVLVQHLNHERKKSERLLNSNLPGGLADGLNDRQD